MAVQYVEMFRPSIRQGLRRYGARPAVRCQCRRHISRSSWGVETNTKYRKGQSYNPLRDNWLTFDGFVGLVGLAIPIGVYFWWTQNEKESLATFPEEARGFIKKGRIIEAQSGPYNDPMEALKNYMSALAACLQAGMDPVSNEVIGLKMQAGVMMDKSASRSDVYNWYDSLFKELQGAMRHQRYSAPVDRERIFMRAALVGIKVSELCEEMQQTQEAEDAIEWVLSNLVLRESSKLGRGLSDQQVMNIYDHAAEIYLLHKKPELALPLYIKSLQESAKSPNCHGLTIMNNICASLQDQQARGQIADEDARREILRNAMQWAERTLKTREKVPSPKWWQWDRRDLSECDLACVTATYNLGKLSEALKNTKEASRRYREAITMSKNIHFKQGIEQAQKSLDSLGSA